MKRKINFIPLILILLLVVAGFWISRNGQVLSEKWQQIQTIIRKYAPAPSQEELFPTEPLEITLPEAAEEPVLEEKPEQELSLEEQPVAAEAPELKAKLSLSEIKEQVEEISGKVEIISLQVAELIEASGEKPIASEEPPSPAGGPAETETQLLAAMEEQVNDIAEQIEIISQQVAELAAGS